MVDCGSIKENELVLQFSEHRYDIASNKELISKCLELCEQYEVTPQNLVYKWEAYADKHGEESPKVEHFEILRAEIARKSSVKQEKGSQSSVHRQGARQGPAFNVNSIQQLGELLVTSSNSANTATGKLKVKTENSASARQATTSSTPMKRSGAEAGISLLPLSSKPKTLPQTPNPPSTIGESPEALRYVNREHKFKTLSIFNEALPLLDRDESSSGRVEIQSIHNVPYYRYLYEKVENKCFILRDRLRSITDGIVDNHQLRERCKEEGAEFTLSPVNLASQEKVWCCGRICSEGDTGALNSFSVALEGANGRRVKLDLSLLPEFSVFPGQIVVVEGNNSTGACLVAHSVFCDATLDMQSTLETKIAVFNETEEFLGGKPMSVVIASGPYSTSTDLNFKPLDDLLAHLSNTRPDVLILCGPFADSSHRLLDPTTGAQGGFSNGDPPDSLDLIRRIFRDHIVAGLKSIGAIKCIIIPSILDLHCPNVFPQPPFEIEVILPGADNMYTQTESLPLLSSNPCTFRLNEIVVSVSTADILLHLSGNEASRLNSDRLARLARHILEQRSFYPLFPASEGTQISLSHMYESEMQVTPDILILPSQLNPFAKRVGDVLCINPGRLTKGSTAGTFAQATIHPMIRNIRVPRAHVKVDEEDAADSKTAEAHFDAPGIKPHKLTEDFDAVNNEVSDSINSEKPGDSISQAIGNSNIPSACVSEELCQPEAPTADPNSKPSPATEFAEKSTDESFAQGSKLTTHRVAERARVEIVRI